MPLILIASSTVPKANPAQRTNCEMAKMTVNPEVEVCGVGALTPAQMAKRTQLRRQLQNCCRTRPMRSGRYQCRNQGGSPILVKLFQPWLVYGGLTKD
jgi:hypothetical protein